jgi:peptide deformylase
MATELTAEQEARRNAALAQVRKWGDPVLREKARAVEAFDGALRAEVERMTGLLEDARGAGLAATQIGVLSRVFVYRMDPEGPVQVMVNPEITATSEETEAFDEGCLSLPGVWFEVERPVRISVRAFDEHGVQRVFDAAGAEADVIQHELDHLDGVLVLDRVPAEQRRAAIRALNGSRTSGSAA